MNILKIKIYVLIALTPIPISGCIGIATTDESIPTINYHEEPSKYVNRVGHMFERKEIEYGARPLNRKDSRAFLLPFPYYSEDNPDNQGKELFGVDISIIAKVAGIKFDLSNVVFWKNNEQKIHPIKIIGLRECLVDDYTIKFKYVDLPTHPITLKENIATCVYLFYPTKTPETKTKFHIQIDGITWNGISLKLPTINYKRSHYLVPHI